MDSADLRYSHDKQSYWLSALQLESFVFGNTKKYFEPRTSFHNPFVFEKNICQWRNLYSTCIYIYIFKKEKKKKRSCMIYLNLSPFIFLVILCGNCCCRLWCKVDGELRQDGNTRDMIFSIPSLIQVWWRKYKFPKQR